MKGAGGRTRAAATWLLGLAPIAFLPGLENRWGWPTLVCVATATLLAAGLVPRGRFPRWYAVLVAAVVSVLIAAAIAGDAPLVQLLGRAPRYEGLVVIGALVAAGWTAARLLGPDAEPSDRRRLALALSTASVLLAAVAVLEALGLRPIESDLARPGSLAGNATDQAILGAIFTAVLGAIALGAYRRRMRVDRWMLAGAAAGVVSVATSASRAGLLALALVALGLTAVLVSGSQRRMRDGLVAAAAVAAAFLIAVAVPLTRDRLFGASAFAQQTVGDRLIMWGDAWRLFVTSPLTGTGPNGFADAITPFFRDGWFDRAQIGAILDSPHNTALQAAVVGGVPGLMLATALTGGALVLGVRHARGTRGSRGDLLWGAAIAVAAAATALLTHVTSPTTMVPLAVLVGALVAAPASHRRPWPIWARVLLGVWLILLLLCTVADGLLRDAKAATMRGDLGRGLSSFSGAQALRPWDVDIAIEAAQTLGGAVENGLAGAADPARDWAERAVSVIPGSSRAHYVAGMVASIRGDTGSAVEHLGTAAELSPADPRIRHELGVARLVSGDPAGAVTDLERAIELAPRSRISWIALRDACLATGDAECVRRAEVQAAAE